MSAPNDEDLSEECKENRRVALAFLDSEERKRYSSQHINDDLGDIEATSAEGKRILKKHGRELCRVLINPMIPDKT
jgi:hypothetical protein